MQYSFGNMLKGGGALNPDGLALDLAFALDKTLTARKGPTPTFTRGSTGTFVGSNGLIQSAAINVPRLDHDATGVCKGLLIEESRTNLQINSTGPIDGQGWIITALDLNNSFAATSPAGGTTVSKITPTIDNTLHHVLFGAGVVISTLYQASVFLKAAGETVAVLWNNVSGAVATFDLSAGTKTSGTGTITNHGNGWWRCSIPYTPNSTNGQIRVYPRQVTAYAGDGTSGILIWGAQLEAGAFPLSYIPTTSSTAIRSADVCSIISTDFTSFYNQPEGTLFADATPQTVDQSVLAVGVNTSAFQNGHFIYKTNATVASSGKRWGATTTVGATPQSTIATATDIAVAQSKLIYGYKINDMAFVVNGLLVGTDNSGTIPTPTAMRIGARDDGLQLNGHIARIQYFRKRLSNAKLQTITAP